MFLMVKGTILNDWLLRKKDEKRRIRVYTINGFQMTGNYIHHDEKVLWIENEGTEKLVFLHAISTIEEENSKAEEMFK